MSAKPLSICWPRLCYVRSMRKRDRRFDIPHPITQWSNLVDVMHRLSPPAWKVVSLIARDDLVNQNKVASPEQKMDRDLYAGAAIRTSEPTASEMRAGLALVGDGARWTPAKSGSVICGGVRDQTNKHKVEHRGTGLPNRTAVDANKEAVQLKILKRRHHSRPGHGHLPTGYSIDWERVADLGEESQKPTVKRQSHQQIRLQFW